MAFNFVYGKLDPLSEKEAPRVKLGDHLTSTPAVPAVVDWASKILSWPMYDNDRYGDCTCAAIGHAIQAWTTYGDGDNIVLPVTDILALYSAVTGFDPATGANDHGAIEQQILAYVQKYGVGGHKIRAFAQVDHRNLTEMKQALDLFGTVYVGFQVPQSCETQFAAGQPWTVVPGSPTVGGHAIDFQKWDENYIYAVTWGKLQPMTPEFWLTYGDEAWVIITDDWIAKNGLSPTGLNLDALLVEFDQITGQPVQGPKHAKPKPPCGLITWFKGLFRK